jgi:hypothetical protein
MSVTALTSNLPKGLKMTKIKLPKLPTGAQVAEIGGWVGMVLIHSATMPAIIGKIMGWSNDLPPLSMVLLVWSGLALFLVRAIARRDWLYTVSNAFGFVLNSVLLSIIVFGS